MIRDIEPDRADDRTWIAELYEREWRPLTRVAYLLTNSRPTAEEIVQDAFVRLQASRTRVLNPGAYLRTVVVNACRDVHRHQAVQPRLPSPDQRRAFVARYLLPDGARISAVGTASGSASEIVEVSGQTLPPTVGLIETPLTIPAGSELNYWRWFADLDISQRATTSGGTELCWRTPVGTGCVEDSFNSPEVGIIPTDGGVILLARRALVEITPPPTDPSAPEFEEGLPLHSITVMLSDGSTATVVVDEGAAFGIGYARLALAPGVTVVSATST